MMFAKLVEKIKNFGVKRFVIIAVAICVMIAGIITITCGIIAYVNYNNADSSITSSNDHVSLNDGDNDFSHVSDADNSSSNNDSSNDTSTSDTSSNASGKDENDVSSNTTSSNNSSTDNSSTNNSSNNSSSKPNNSNSNNNNSNNSNSNGVNNPDNIKNGKDYIDTSLLTGTQDDVGMVVGYSPVEQKDITVVSVEDSTTPDGLRYIETVFSNDTLAGIIECKYCHEFPCPNGGDERCTNYDPKLDDYVTCQMCGRPRGDGYNGTCYQTIDWLAGGRVSCNHYD